MNIRNFSKMPPEKVGGGGGGRVKRKKGDELKRSSRREEISGPDNYRGVQISIIPTTWKRENERGNEKLHEKTRGPDARLLERTTQLREIELPMGTGERVIN